MVFISSKTFPVLRVLGLLGWVCLVGCTQRASGSPTGMDGSSGVPVSVAVSSSRTLTSQTSHSSVAASSSSSSAPLSSSSSALNLGSYADLFVWVPGGSFTRVDGAVVTVRGFYMSKTEIPQSLFSLFYGSNPSSNLLNPAYPVETVSWFQAARFCNKLSKAVGLDTAYRYTSVSQTGILNSLATFPAITAVRLPTEAEWEYAARAGATTVYSWGDQISGTFPGLYTNPNISTVPDVIATYRANAFGLYDMEGNVQEWTHDWYGPLVYSAALSNPTGASSGVMRATRNGGYNVALTSRTLATRSGIAPETIRENLGFRVVISITP